MKSVPKLPDEPPIWLKWAGPIGGLLWLGFRVVSSAVN